MFLLDCVQYNSINRRNSGPFTNTINIILSISTLETAHPNNLSFAVQDEIIKQPLKN